PYSFPADGSRSARVVSRSVLVDDVRRARSRRVRPSSSDAGLDETPTCWPRESPLIPHVSVIVHPPHRYRGESIKSVAIGRSMDSGRIYRHFCMMARALEVVGEHWSLPIVRDLLLGPQRFTDLARSLQEITPTRLTNRLRQLEAAGAVTPEPQTSGGR